MDALLEGLDLGELRLDVGALLQQALAVGSEHLAEALELRPLVAPRLVHVDQLADLGERQAEALAAQRELEARAVARRVDAPLAVAPRREQSLVLVEADRARRDVEFAPELADRKFGAFRFHIRCCGHFIAAHFLGFASISLAANAGSRHDDRSRAGHSLAQHAAAVRARPYQSVAGAGRRR